jgi:hypothetical protein
LEPLSSENTQPEEKLRALISIFRPAMLNQKMAFDVPVNMKALGAKVVEDVPFRSSTESGDQSLSIRWNTIRK